jgi:hypothetical protein
MDEWRKYDKEQINHKIPFKKIKDGPGAVTKACNSSYLGAEIGKIII